MTGDVDDEGEPMGVDDPDSDDDNDMDADLVEEVEIDGAPSDEDNIPWTTNKGPKTRSFRQIVSDKAATYTNSQTHQRQYRKL